MIGTVVCSRCENVLSGTWLPEGKAAEDAGAPENAELDAALDAELPPLDDAAVDTLEPGASEVAVEELEGPKRIVVALPPATMPVDPVELAEDRMNRLAKDAGSF